MSKFRDANEKLLKPIPKNLFETILQKNLCHFTAFQAGKKFYRQLEGLGMGDSVSPILANIFLGKLEEDLVEELLESKKIHSYRRYMDDCYLVIPRGQSIKIFEHFNNLHPSIKFTLDLPKEKCLKFLDFEIYEDLNTMNFEIRGFEKNPVTMEFKRDVGPTKIKKGILTGDIKRAHFKNSTKRGLSDDLDKLRKKYLDLNYPETMIREEILRCDSPKPDSGIDWEKEKSEFPERNFTLQIPFTDFRVEKISRKIRNTLRSITPKFNLNIVHRTITIRNTLVKQLNPKFDPFSLINSVYFFECFCGSSYVGESERQARTRIKEHNQSSREPQYLSTIPVVLFTKQNYRHIVLIQDHKKTRLFM
jgi:hypothetical protein